MLEINNTTSQKVNIKKTGLLVEKFLRAYKRSGSLVSLAIVGQARMRYLNKRYRGMDKTTDVLSFAGEGKYLGEIVININEVGKVSKYQEMLQELKIDPGSKSKAAALNYIFYFLLVHGLLHLLGHNDEKETERQVMLRLGKKFLDSAGKML